MFTAPITCKLQCNLHWKLHRALCIAYPAIVFTVALGTWSASAQRFSSGTFEEFSSGNRSPTAAAVCNESDHRRVDRFAELISEEQSCGLRRDNTR